MDPTTAHTTHSYTNTPAGAAHCLSGAPQEGMPSSQGSHQAPVSTKHNTSLPHMHQQSLSTVVGTNLPEASNVNEVSPVLRRTPITTASRFQREDAAAAKCETIPPNKTVPSMPEDSSRNPAETKASRLQREQIEQSSWSM